MGKAQGLFPINGDILPLFKGKCQGGGARDARLGSEFRGGACGAGLHVDEETTEHTEKGLHVGWQSTVERGERGRGAAPSMLRSAPPLLKRKRWHRCHRLTLDYTSSITSRRAPCTNVCQDPSGAGSGSNAYYPPETALS